MINTKDFRTKTEYKRTNNPHVEGVSIIAIDIGYSGIKTAYEDGFFCIPYYAKDLGINPELTSMEMKEGDVFYRNAHNKHIWKVGKSAQELVSQSDTNDYDGELVSRYRYQSEMYEVALETAIGLALIHKGYRSPKDLNGDLVIQTGLPPAYLDEDTELIKDAFKGRHCFSLKVPETKEYIQFDFELSSGNISVMSQPKGTLMSLIMNDDGTPSDYVNIFDKNGAIIDIGYGTLDLFEIRGRSVSGKESFTAFSMKSVLERTSEKIKEKYGVKLRSSSMQNCLESGYVKIFKRIKGMPPKAKNVDFSELLEEANREVCNEALEKLLNSFDFSEYKYIVLTGGTAAAWEKYIREYFSGMDELKIILGDENTHIGMTYANVRGYYFQQYRIQLKKRMKVA